MGFREFNVVNKADYLGWQFHTSPTLRRRISSEHWAAYSSVIRPTPSHVAPARLRVEHELPARDDLDSIRRRPDPWRLGEEIPIATQSGLDELFTRHEVPG